MKRRLFNIAWAVRNQFATFSEALKYAWAVIKFQFELCIGIVKFEYKKIDGTIRKAIGTLDNVPKTKGLKPANYQVITYYDLQAENWRSFKSENFIGIV